MSLNNEKQGKQKTKASEVNISTTGITCKKFYNRLAYCYYFKERQTYTKNARLLFNKILNIYAKEEKALIEIFSNEFSNRSYVGKNSVEKVNREEFKTFCLNCAINLDRLFSEYKIISMLDKYCFKWKVKGYIDCIIKSLNKEYNLSLSFEERKITEKEVDFFCLNNYIYNECKNKTNDLLVMCVPQDLFYLVPYNDKDYTIQRGFLTFSKINKLRRRGEHCNRCFNSCKPRFYNGLERLKLII